MVVLYSTLYLHLCCVFQHTHIILFSIQNYSLLDNRLLPIIVLICAYYMVSDAYSLLYLYLSPSFFTWLFSLLLNYNFFHVKRYVKSSLSSMHIIVCIIGNPWFHRWNLKTHTQMKFYFYYKSQMCVCNLKIHESWPLIYLVFLWHVSASA